jgi:hypothetical protein
MTISEVSVCDFLVQCNWAEHHGVTACGRGSSLLHGTQKAGEKERNEGHK